MCFRKIKYINFKLFIEKSEDTQKDDEKNYGFNELLELLDKLEANEDSENIDLENARIDVMVYDQLYKRFVKLWADKDKDSCENEI